MKHKPFSRIAWAVDPCADPMSLGTPLRVLKYLAEESNSVIQPICVTSSDKSVDFDGSNERLSKMKVAINKELIEKLLSGIHQKNILSPQSIESDSTYAYQATDALIDSARGFNADLIVAGTHGWTGLNRFFRGSFVELLLTRSPIPVMTLGPDLTKVRPFERVLYACHLSPTSRQGFREAVSVSLCFHSELTVLHVLSRRERDHEGDNSTAVGEMLPSSSHLKRRSHIWTSWAKKKGVVAKIVIQDAMAQVSEQILREAHRNHIGLIMIDAHSGHLESILKGSRIRQIVRNAQCPVFVRGAPRVMQQTSPGEIEKEVMSDLIGHGRKKDAA